MDTKYLLWKQKQFSKETLLLKILKEIGRIAALLDIDIIFYNFNL